MQLAQHRPLQRIGYNVAVLALVALAAGVLIAPINSDGVGALVGKVVIAATADNVVNVVLISAAMALSTGHRYIPLIRKNVRATAVPFAFMASAALMLVVLWERSPALSTALVGPLLAIASTSLVRGSIATMAPRYAPSASMAACCTKGSRVVSMVELPPT